MPFDPGQAEFLAELPEALVILARSGEIVYVNHALEALTGFEQRDLVGEDISKLLPQPARRRVQAIDWLGRWADDPNPDQLRYLNLEAGTKAGDVLLVSVRVSKHSEAEETWFLVVMRDVTSQHETVSAMRHAQLVTNRILAIGEDAIVSINAEHKVVYCNPAAERLFGYTHEELIGQPLSRLLPASSRDRHDGLVEEFAHGTEASRLMGARREISGLTRDGSLLPLEISITKTPVDGEMILSAQIRDISARKAADRALKDSEARFRTIFENAVEAIALLSPSGEVLEINVAAREMLPAFEASQRFWELDWWGGGASDAARTELEDSVRRCAAGQTIRTRVRLLRGDGEHEVDFSLIPVRPDGQGVIYILAEGRDITQDAGRA